MTKLKLLPLLILAALFTCCDSKKNTPGEKTARNVLMYMVGDNNLQNALFSDVNDMEKAWSESYDGRLFVLFNSAISTNLYLIKQDNDIKKINSQIIMTFPSDFDPCKKGALTDVIDYIQQNYESDQLALMISSHGSGWLPDPYSSQPTARAEHSKLLIPATPTNDGQQRTIGTTDKNPTDRKSVV